MTVDNDSATHPKTVGQYTHMLRRRPTRRSTLYLRCFKNLYHGMSYLQPTPRYHCDTKISVHHWQLLDLMHYDPSTRRVYYTRDDLIRALGPDGTLEVHFELDYLPKCFNVAPGGVVATGGMLQPNLKLMVLFDALGDRPSRKVSAGLFTFYNPELGELKTVRVGEMINNDVAIYLDTLRYDGYICNNDLFLYCLDINGSAMTVTAQINCEVNTCLNNVVSNPQCRKLLTVLGDTSLLYMVDPSSPLPIIKTIPTDHDLGFGIAYHDDGRMFSLVFQDGLCLLYDIRNLDQPLVEIKLTRPGHTPGAFRLCKFLPGLNQNDMLLVLEHVGRVHMIDLRRASPETIDDHQVLVMPVALEQYAEFMVSNKRRLLKLRGETPDDLGPDSLRHDSVTLYDDTTKNYPLFLAPLVYDYEYLVRENPTLFKDYAYTPPAPPLPPGVPAPKFKVPQWGRLAPADDPAVAPDCQDFADIGVHLDDVYGGEEEDDEYAHYVVSDRGPFMGLEHIDGEMPIAGIEYFTPSLGGPKIMVGSKGYGIVEWEVNSLARRAFESCEYV